MSRRNHDFIYRMTLKKVFVISFGSLLAIFLVSWIKAKKLESLLAQQSRCYTVAKVNSVVYIKGLPYVDYVYMVGTDCYHHTASSTIKFSINQTTEPVFIPIAYSVEEPYYHFPIFQKVIKDKCHIGMNLERDYLKNTNNFWKVLWSIKPKAKKQKCLNE